MRTRLRDALREIANAHPGSGSSASRPASRCTPAGSTRRWPPPPSRPSARAPPPGTASPSPRARRSSSCRWWRPTRAPPSTSSAPSSRPARCCSSATTSPTRTPSATCTAPTWASRSVSGTRRPTTGSPSRSRPPARSVCCWRPGGTGSSASGPCRSSGTRCSPTGVPSRCSPPRPRSPGSATPSRTRRRSSPTWSAAAPPGTSASPPSAAASRSASATAPAR